MYTCAMEKHNEERNRKGIYMIILHIEHSVSNFDAWKKAFDAEGLLATMREVWRGGAQGTIIENPQARIVEVVESKEL